MAEDDSDPGSPVTLRSGAWDSYWNTVGPRLGTSPGGFARWCLPFLTGSAPGSRVLELGCGPARDLRFFVEEGFSVDGVDSSPAALALAHDTLEGLPESLRSRAKLTEVEALADLERIGPNRYDAVVGIVLYETMSDPELARLFPLIRSRLRPGGLHLWCVRSTNYPLKDQPWLIPPNLGGNASQLPHRLFTVRETEKLILGEFVRVRWEDVSERHYLYIADRRVV